VSQAKKIYFENLDGLRFIAFFLVFMHHMIKFDFVVEIPVLKEIVDLIFHAGKVGVNFFFVLSGFLISYLIFEESERFGKLNLKKFYVRRTLRIWPLYFLVLIFGFWIYPYLKSFIGIETELTNLPMYYFTFLANFDVLDIYSSIRDGKSALMLDITWSVAIEEQFYLFWPLIFIFFSKKRIWLLIMTLIMLFSIAFKLYHAEENLLNYYHTFACLYFLALGGIGAYFVMYSNVFKQKLANLPKGLIFLIYLVGWTVMVMIGQTGQMTKVILSLISGAFYLFVILDQNFSKYSFYKIGSLKCLTNLGKYTYGLYLLHPIGIQVSIVLIKYLNIENLSNTQVFMFNLLSFVCTLCFAWASFHYFELYFLKIKSKFALLKTGRN